MAEPFVEMLRGERNNLGRTEEVVAIVLATPDRIDELYDCFFQPDEWVRLRTSSSFKRIWRADAELFDPYLDRFIADVSSIDQPSVQWTFAEMCSDLAHRFTAAQRASATKRLQAYVDESEDWIVLNRTVESLGRWSTDDAALATWLTPHLHRLAGDDRKTVARRAQGWLERLTS